MNVSSFTTHNHNIVPQKLKNGHMLTPSAINTCTQFLKICLLQKNITEMDVRNKATKTPVWIQNDGFLDTVQQAMKMSSLRFTVYVLSIALIHRSHQLASLKLYKGAGPPCRPTFIE